jgi:hypothetical protein
MKARFGFERKDFEDEARASEVRKTVKRDPAYS